ncbi:hypothetical protein ACP275_13G065600 [Erythranthe tilingii]
MGSRIKTLNGNQAWCLRPCSSNPTPIDSVEDMGVRKIFKLKYEELAAYTDDFSESNFLSYFQFGKLYRGKIVRGGQSTQYVMVKIWQVPEIYSYRPGDNQARQMDEVMLLRHEKLNNHPGMLRLYGYCKESDHVGVVYEFKPFASVFNLIPKDGFSWLQRIKVALGFASVLRFLHTKNGSFYKPFIVRNLDCAHIVVDEDYNPKLCDFGLISGGIFRDRTVFTSYHVLGSIGYIDLDSIYEEEFTVKQDVYAFGVILLNLISKRVYKVETRCKNPEEVYNWAWQEFSAFLSQKKRESSLKNNRFSLVHQSLKDEPDFVAVDGEKITWLALKCTASDLTERPTMKQVMRTLLKLKLVNRNVDFLGLKNNYKVVRTCANAL